MKPAFLRLLGVTVVAGVVWAVPASTGQDYLDDGPPAALSDDAVVDVPPGLEDLARATTPSAAVEAYARARLAAPDDLLVDQVYVHRMVELGAPDMCAAQAERIVRHVPDNGLAWAVLAFNAARANDFVTALTHIARAARYAPRDPFVQRTAGQLLAWYDTQADPSELPATAREAARDIRRTLGGQHEFAEAYREARGFYRQSEETPQPAPVEPVPGPSVTIVEPSYRDYGYDYGYVYPRYSTGYVGYPWYGGVSSCFSTGTNVVIVPGGRDHRHRHNRYSTVCTDRPRSYSVFDPAGDGVIRRPGSDHPGSRHGSGAAPGAVHRPGRTPGNSGSGVRSDPPASPTRHSLWADTPGLKRPSTPGLKPPARPGLKPPATPGLKPPTTPGLKPPAPPRHSAPPPPAARSSSHRVARPAVAAPPRRAPAPIVVPRSGSRGR
jgi:hypothetical protein